VVPLADRLGGELDRLSRREHWTLPEDLVFCNPHTGNALNANTLTKTFDRHRAAAGVREVTFHELRHTFGTRMAAAGIPIRTLQEWMGHADITTTQIYAHYAPSAHEVAQINGAFASPNPSPKLSASPSTPANSDQQNPC
jgi:integrase